MGHPNDLDHYIFIFGIHYTIQQDYEFLTVESTPFRIATSELSVRRTFSYGPSRVEIYVHHVCANKVL